MKSRARFVFGISGPARIFFFFFWQRSRSKPLPHNFREAFLLVSKKRRRRKKKNSMAATRSSSGAMKPSRSLSLEYPLDLIPAGGSEVVCATAAPIKHENKDAAGHIFHAFALRQSGVGKLLFLFSFRCWVPLATLFRAVDGSDFVRPWARACTRP